MMEDLELLENKKMNVLSKKIVLSSHKSTIVVDLTEIEYLSSNGCYTTFYLNNKNEFVTSKPISYYSKLLENSNFFRIHHKYIINIKYLEEILNGTPFRIKLSSGKVLPVTRFKKNDFMKLFIH